MNLPYDPAAGPAFWKAISRIPGYPEGIEQPITYMIFESDAIYMTSDLLKEVGADPADRLLIVMDQTSMRRGLEDLKLLSLTLLWRAGWHIDGVIMDPDLTGQVHTDMPHIEQVKASLRPGTSVLSIGSGVVTDIAKHACYLFHQETGHRVPFVVYQTANSVSAYTSNMAPVFVDGVKRTLDSTYPDALICDLETLRYAPREMTVAGVGDLLAVFVSLPDWYLAHRLGMDASYNELPSKLMGPLDQIFMSAAGGIRIGSIEGMSILARLISLGGLAMSLTHATTPMSGYEHVMSHILDLQAETSGQPMAQHGTQVSMAAIIGAEVYRRFLAEFDPSSVALDRCDPSPEEMRRRVRAAFDRIDPSGKAGEECWSDYKLKLEKWTAHRADFEAFLADWPAIRDRLTSLTAPPERLAEILKAIDAPVRFADLVPPASEEQVRFAFMNAPLMRKRLTIGDMLIFLGWDRDKLWDEVWAKTQAL